MSKNRLRGKIPSAYFHWRKDEMENTKLLKYVGPEEIFGFRSVTVEPGTITRVTDADAEALQRDYPDFFEEVEEAEYPGLAKMPVEGACKEPYIYACDEDEPVIRIAEVDVVEETTVTPDEDEDEEGDAEESVVADAPEATVTSDEDEEGDAEESTAADAPDTGDVEDEQPEEKTEGTEPPVSKDIDTAPRRRRARA